MLNSPTQIAELAASLGTIDGLQRVSFETDLLNAHLAKRDISWSRDELVKMRTALGFLSSAIVEMSRVVRAILAEAGVRPDHVG